MWNKLMLILSFIVKHQQCFIQQNKTTAVAINLKHIRRTRQRICLCLFAGNHRRVPTWNLVTHCELQKLRIFPSGNVAWYCGNEFLLQKWHVGSVSARTERQKNLFPYKSLTVFPDLRDECLETLLRIFLLLDIQKAYNKPINLNTIILHSEHPNQPSPSWTLVIVLPLPTFLCSKWEHAASFISKVLNVRTTLNNHLVPTRY